MRFRGSVFVASFPFLSPSTRLGLAHGQSHLIGLCHQKTGDMTCARPGRLLLDTLDTGGYNLPRIAGCRGAVGHGDGHGDGHGETVTAHGRDARSASMLAAQRLRCRCRDVYSVDISVVWISFVSMAAIRSTSC